MYAAVSAFPSYQGFSSASLSVLVRNSQLPWLPAAKGWYSSPQLLTQLFTKGNCLFAWAS